MSEGEEISLRKSLELNGIEHLFPVFAENGVHKFKQLSDTVLDDIVVDPEDQAVIESMLEQLLLNESITASDITNVPGTSNTSNFSSCSSSNSSSNKSVRRTRNLRDILIRSLEGKVVLSGAENKTIIRRQLAKLLIEKKLNEDVNKKISKEKFLEMREEIINTFPFERREIYHIPARTMNKKKKMVAKGVLYDHYCNKRRKLMKLGLVRKEKGEIVEETHILSASEEDDIAWLKNSLDPWIIVTQKWRNTSEGRAMVTKDYIIEGILKTFPGFKHNLGYTLDCTPDQLDDSIAALWLLPLYFPLKKIKNSSWRPSKLEAQEGFLLLVKIIADIQPNLVYKKNKHSQLKLTMQPISILVGQNIFNIEKSFVSVNDILWEMMSPLKAIDLCFKSFHVFNAKYPAEICATDIL